MLSFFTNFSNYKRDAEVERYPWNKTASMPSFTGFCNLVHLEGLKAAFETSKDEIIAMVKSELDRRWLGSQSKFDKEEKITKMGELHIKLIRKLEVVSHKFLSTAIQAGYAVCRC